MKIETDIDPSLKQIVILRRGRGYSTNVNTVM